MRQSVTGSISLDCFNWDILYFTNLRHYSSQNTSLYYRPIWTHLRAACSLPCRECKNKALLLLCCSDFPVLADHFLWQSSVCLCVPLWEVSRFHTAHVSGVLWRLLTAGVTSVQWLRRNFMGRVDGSPWAIGDVIKNEITAETDMFPHLSQL